MTREWHLITGEYPPQRGGVADYSRLVAAGLGRSGERVHVWCPPAPGETAAVEGVEVHRDLGRLSRADLRAVGKSLDLEPAPRRLLVQWVPHGFGYQAMNVGFCAWLLQRSRVAGDEVYLMVHEASVTFGGSWKQHVLAAVHRVMVALLLQAADQVWVGTPAWADRLRPFRFGRRLSFDWLPVPSNVPRVADPAATRRVRGLLVGDGESLIGHFGTYGRLIAPLLDELIIELAGAAPRSRFLLLGHGGSAYRDELVGRHPELAARVIAPEGLGDRDLSLHISACDLFVQPYPEGVNSRRGSAMAVLGHGRPLVTTSGEYTEPVWRHGDTAWLVPRGDMGALAGAAAEVAGDAELLGRLAAGAESLYSARFDLRYSVDGVRAAGDRLDAARSATEPSGRVG